MIEDKKRKFEVDTCVTTTMISEDDWDAVGQRKKEQLRRCEICGKACDPADLRARHLAYGPEVDEKYMLIVCPQCNYQLHLAEAENNKKIKALNEALEADIRALCQPLYERYFAARLDITTDAMVAAVGTYRTNKRPVISHLFRYPHIDGDADLIKDAMRRGYGGCSSNEFNLLVKDKLDKLRREIALSDHDTPAQTSTPTQSEQLVLPLFEDEPHNK